MRSLQWLFGARRPPVGHAAGLGRRRPVLTGRSPGRVAARGSAPDRCWPAAAASARWCPAAPADRWKTGKKNLVSRRTDLIRLLPRIVGMTTRDMRAPEPARCPTGGGAAENDLNWLLDRVARGDQAAFGAVYDQLAGPVYGLICKVLRDRPSPRKWPRKCCWKSGAGRPVSTRPRAARRPGSW